MRLQPIFDIAQIFALHGITQAVLCPGSRCAPLTLAFTRHSEINCRTFNDERSAGFVALGLAQQLQMPVALICTSGSAAYNFAPAVAEAYFQQIPLLILTADRPTEWIDQLDGQTIRQNNLYGRHVKNSVSLPEDYSHEDAKWFINRVVNESINLSQTFPAGPVHINIPLREPLYPSDKESITFSKSVRVIKRFNTISQLTNSELNRLKTELSVTQKILLVSGQLDHHEGLLKAIDKFCRSNHVALVGDIVSNLQSAGSNSPRADSFLAQCPQSVSQALQPDLLITIGKSTLSKNLKLFLRKHPPRHHWHIQQGGAVADTFQSLTRTIQADPQSILELLTRAEKPDAFEEQKKDNYSQLWKAEEHRIELATKKFSSEKKFSEFHAIAFLLSKLPERCNLHLANSMTARYVNLLGLGSQAKGIHVFCNRGTSGIDGCTSTAVGHSLVSDVPNILITGDLAFFYDRNAFWHNYALPNLRIIVINNQGGVIFNLIDGPGNLPEKEEFFITNQKLNARSLTTEFKFDYLPVTSLNDLQKVAPDFFTFDGKTKILEVLSDQETARNTFTEYKTHIKSSYES